MSVDLNEDIVIQYEEEQEDLLKRYGESALIYSVLYRQAYQYYEQVLVGINIPCIVLSSLSSLLSFLSEKLTPYFTYYFIVVGALSFFSATLTTLLTFLKISNKLSSARLAQIQYNKLYRNIEIQLALRRENRTNFIELIKVIKDTFQQIKEQADELPDHIISKFKEKYKSNPAILYPEEISLRPIKLNTKIFDKRKSIAPPASRIRTGLIALCYQHESI